MNVLSHGPSLPVFLFLSIAAIALFSFVAVASWSDARRREREAYYKSETLKKLAESQAGGAASVLELIREQDRKDSRRLREGTKLGGLITTAVGIAVIPLLRGIVREEPVFLAGLVPLLIGLAMLVYVYALAPKE